MPSQVNSCKVKSDHIKAGNVMSNQVGSSQVQSGSGKSSQAKSSQAESRLVKSIQVKSSKELSIQAIFSSVNLFFQHPAIYFFKSIFTCFLSCFCPLLSMLGIFCYFLHNSLYHFWKHVALKNSSSRNATNVSKDFFYLLLIYQKRGANKPFCRRCKANFWTLSPFFLSLNS